MNSSEIPVVTIDGPSGAGKGTVSVALSKHLQWHYLDSGVIYRWLAWTVKYCQIPWENEYAIKELTKELLVSPVPDPSSSKYMFSFRGKTFCIALKDEKIGIHAAQIAALPQVREALLERQRKQVRYPGLIADGRDMGTVVFPNATLKFFLTASVEERARRRFRQLQDTEQNATFKRTLEDMRIRDANDRNRNFAPMIFAEDAVHIDSTGLDIKQVVTRLLSIMKDTNVIESIGKF